MERKATDILLDLERKLDLLLGYYQAVDFSQKLVLTKLSAIEKKLIEYPLITKESSNDFLDPGLNVSIEQEISLDLKPAKRRDQRLANSPMLEQSQVTFPNPSPPKPIETIIGVVKPVPVQQKVIYPDGKNVILANVEIFDLNGKIVKKTKTNSAGKWNAVLVAGKYKVHVSKNATSEKPHVERAIWVEIPLSETLVELQPLQ